MSRKTGGATSLSNGTLSLRFMQRGAAQKVTAATAKVIDEAEWDIGPTARAAWGVTSTVNLDSATKVPIHVTRDESYLPFVFGRTPDPTDQRPLDEDLETKPGRRRIFREGTEVNHEVSSEAANSSNEPGKSGTKTESDINAQGPSNPTKGQPKSISSPRKPNDAQVTNKPGVRRHRLEEFLKPSTPLTAGFLKPSGVSSVSKRMLEDSTTAPRGKTMRIE
ncbi:unnamed protein product [Rhizoctonia solani]|uniref:Uncharacterized protein n=1 Tax=Rhizoctonia solani TaxID=456999 RepID=A0A8H3DZ29_9AGAM|nr:unnamed protein product [Rhizoctonia solani]